MKRFHNLGLTRSATRAAILGLALAGSAFTATAEIPKPVTVENTPTVNVGNSPTVNVGNTPSVTVGNFPDVQDVSVKATPGGYTLRIEATSVDATPLTQTVPFDSFLVGVLLTARRLGVLTAETCNVGFRYQNSSAKPIGQEDTTIAFAHLSVNDGQGSPALYVPLPDMFIASGEAIELGVAVGAGEDASADCVANATVYLRPQ